MFWTNENQIWQQSETQFFSLYHKIVLDETFLTETLFGVIKK